MHLAWWLWLVVSQLLPVEGSPSVRKPVRRHLASVPNISSSLYNASEGTGAHQSAHERPIGGGFVSKEQIEKQKELAAKRKEAAEAATRDQRAKAEALRKKKIGREKRMVRQFGEKIEANNKELIVDGKHVVSKWKKPDELDPSTWRYLDKGIIEKKNGVLENKKAKAKTNLKRMLRVSRMLRDSGSPQPKAGIASMQQNRASPQSGVSAPSLQRSEGILTPLIGPDSSRLRPKRVKRKKASPPRK